MNNRIVTLCTRCLVINTYTAQGTHQSRKPAGRGKERKNTSGKMCKVFVPSAGMLAEPMKFEQLHTVM